MTPAPTASLDIDTALRKADSLAKAAENLAEVCEDELGVSAPNTSAKLVELGLLLKGIRRQLREAGLNAEVNP